MNVTASRLPPTPSDRPVTVEYDSRGARARKTFPTAYAARRFYAIKYREGRNPRIVSAQR